MTDKVQEKTVITVKKKRYFLSGKSEIVTKRGQLKAVEVHPRDFPKGQERIDALVKSGDLVER